MTDESDEGLCRECGNHMVIKADGVSHHVNDEGDVDFDADADHVAVLDSNI